MHRRNFEKLLLEALDEGLSSLGQSSKQAIYFHLEKSFDVKRQEIPCNLEVFVDAIEKIFGSGAYFIEILIMKRLHEKTGVAFKLRESTDFAFIEYVAAAKRDLLEKNKTEKITEKIVQCEEIKIKG